MAATTTAAPAAAAAAAAPALPKTHKVIEVPTPGAPFTIVDRPLPELGPTDVLVRVEACGICHSDCFAKEGWWPGLTFPTVPGHEVAGVVVALGPHARRFKIGDRVGAGWHGSHCFACGPCLHGDFCMCKERTVRGLSAPGGYQQYMKASWEALAKIPDNLSFTDAAPLTCAGVTVFNALRRQKLAPGALVAVQGIGGLGHLGIQFANKMGFRVVALSRGAEKEELAKKLGAHIYIDTAKQDAVKELQALGGAAAIVATAFDSAAMSALLPALGPSGVLLLAGADTSKPVEVNAGVAIGSRSSVTGVYSGATVDTEDTLEFAALTGVRPMNEVVPFEKVTEAYQNMMTNKARFRAVISFSSQQ